MTVNVKTNNSNKTLIEKNQKVSISITKLWSGDVRDYEVTITLSDIPANYTALCFLGKDDDYPTYCAKNIVWNTNNFIDNSEALIGMSAMGNEYWSCIIRNAKTQVTKKSITVESQKFTSKTISTPIRLIAAYGLNLVV